MGFFSGSTKVSCSSVVRSLVGTPPDGVKEATLYAILQGSSIPEGLMENALGGISGKMDRLYKYGYEKYFFGLPTGKVGGVAQAQHSLVKSIIEEELGGGQEIIILYTFIDKLSPEMASMEFLRTERRFKISTNEVRNHPFTIMYPNNEPVLLSRVEYLPATQQLKLWYHHNYGYRTALKEIFSEVIACPPNMYLGDDYCVAAYNILDENGDAIPEELFWYYQLRTGTHPELKVAGTDFGTGAYFPIVPIRREGQDLTTAHWRASPLYETSKGVLKKISLNIDDIAAKLNENPDIAKIDHAYVLFCVDVQSKKQEVMSYLCDYFGYLGDVQLYNREDYYAAIINNQVGVYNKVDTYAIKDQFNNHPPDVTLDEFGLSISINYNYITTKVVSGSIGPVGYVTSQTMFSYAPFSFYVGIRDNSFIRFRKQLSRKTYREVTVYGLSTFNNVYEGHGVFIDLGQSLSDPDDNRMMIPLHYGIMQHVPLMQRNAIYYESVNLMINTYQVTHSKWYQTGIFRMVFFVVAIVIAAYSGQGWIVGLVAAAEAGAIAVIMYLLPALLLGIAMNVAMKYVAKMLGAEWAMIIGAVMMVAAIGSNVGGTGSFNMFGHTMPTAQTMLSAGKALMDAGVGEIKADILDVQKETALFETESGKQWDALAEATKLLDSNSGMNPMEMISPFKTFRGFANESPDAFYNRTIHTGNIGVLALDVVENYAEIMLKLPEVKYLT